ncbi:phage integrase N-terminal SAM-like domain-containing protein [Geodermatophilus poikilotrophus]|uniref:Phage integrase, N-terminal SAM-like domain n=1 Tax=Geodermatophilus poikilotrophus TaxID=1333667 RepID=A0A1I0IMH7_9ACTN|nr:phage integrase N-terminal SAM-like domain-containing protein [Geodermatophilus poikilotrophus]SET98325.1 Phage integrase, N-terminal SAM-like domain [Geodermatophilus poikilotrophus]
MPTRWEHLRRDYATCLRAEGKSPNTVRLYLGAVDKLHAWCLAHDGPDDPTEISRIALSTFMAGLTDTWRPATCSLTFRALQQFSGWLVREEAMTRSPMARMRAPHVPEQPTPVLTDEELRRLLGTGALIGPDVVDGLRPVVRLRF